jgi:hypothetical protein
MGPAKVIGIIQRRADFDVPGFSAYWRTVHRAEALKLRRFLRGYVQQHLLETPVPGLARPECDGLPTLWVDDFTVLADLAASDEYMTGAYLDEPRFMAERSSGLTVEPAEILPACYGRGTKLILFWRTQPGVDPAALDPGTMLAGAMPNVIGHVRNRVLNAADQQPRYAFDLVEELWWPDRATAEADWAARAFATSLIDPATSRAAWVEELPVLPDAHTEAA